MERLKLVKTNSGYELTTYILAFPPYNHVLVASDAEAIALIRTEAHEQAAPPFDNLIFRGRLLSAMVGTCPYSPTWEDIDRIEKDAVTA